MNSVMVSGAKWSGKFTGAATWQTPGAVTVPTPVGGVAVQTITCTCLTPGAVPVVPVIVVTYNFSTKCKIDNKPVLEKMSCSSTLICKVPSGWSMKTLTTSASFNISGDSKKVKDSAAWLTLRGADNTPSVTFINTNQKVTNID